MQETYPLSVDQETALVVRAVKGDLKAEDALVRAFRPLLTKCAKQHARARRLDADDLFQEMAIAMISALPNFDPSRARLSTFLEYRFLGVATRIGRQEDPDKFRKWATVKIPKERREVRGRDRLTGPISHLWPEGAIKYIKNLRRKNDKRIAKGLWLDYPPRTQAEMARRLRMSRSAVTQRVKKIKRALWRRFGILHYSQWSEGNLLNTYEPDDI